MSTLQGLKSRRADPLLRNVELPFCFTFYPLGFCLEIATNSSEVVDAAREAWGTFAPQFDRRPMRLRIVVSPAGDLAPEPVYRSQEHLFTIVADRDNLATMDPDAMSGFCYVSEKTAADHAWFRWHFLEALVYMMLAQRHVVPVHAACVERNGAGVLLCGASGAGKSTLAWACARAGWTYIGDDAIMLLPDARELIGIGKPHQARFCEDAPRLFPELAEYSTCARPNGKLALEVPLAHFPEVRTSARCAIGMVVFPERRVGAAPMLESLPEGEVLDRLLGESPDYGDEVFANHARVMSRIAARPAYRMRYDTIAEALDLLAGLTCRDH